MKYTKRNSINEIMNGMKNTVTKKYFEILFPKILIDVVPDKFWNSALDEVEKYVKMPWGMPFLSDDMVRSANLADEIAVNRLYKFIPLWEPETDTYVPDVECGDKKSVF